MNGLDFPEAGVWRVLRQRGEIIILFVLSVVTALPFVFKGFVTTGDPLRYALGLHHVLADGIGQIAQAFNGDMSPAYYLLSYGLLKLTPASMDMSAVLNTLNASVSVVLLLLLYAFFSSLTERRWVAFFACLTTLLSPSIWLLSHESHPILLALAAFVGSLIVADLILRNFVDGIPVRSLWIWFTVLCVIAMAMRLDIVLCFGAYLGLVLCRRAFSLKLLLPGLATMCMVCLVYGCFRYAVLGYVFPQGGGTIAIHLSTRLESQHVLNSLIQNLAYWAMGTNALVFLLGACALIFVYARLRLGILMLIWTLPWCVFLPFRGMDFSRIAAPSIPIIVLVAIEFVGSIAKSRAFLALCATLLLAQLASVVLYYPLVKAYSFKTSIDGRRLAMVPIGFLPVDHYYRQRSITKDLQVAKDVTTHRGTSIGVIGDSVMAYTFYLEQANDILPKDEERCNGLVYEVYAAGSIEFFVCDLAHNSSISNPLRKFAECLAGKHATIHIIPHSRDYVLGLDKRSK